MLVLCTEPALPNLRRIGPQDHFGTNLEPSRLDPIVKVVRKLFRGFHFTVTVRITDRGLFVRAALARAQDVGPGIVRYQQGGALRRFGSRRWPHPALS